MVDHKADDMPAETYNRSKLFWIGVISLFTAAFSFSLRIAVSGDIQADYIMPFDPLNAGQLIGSALGVAFLGFAVSLFLTSLVLDKIGMGRMLIIASLFFILGPALIIAADVLADGFGVYRLIWLGMLLNGLGWGFTESAINPMTAALYPEDKVNRMNVIHAWWPAGLIFGGLAGYAVGVFGIDWRVAIGLIAIPPLFIIPMAMSEKFPKTESTMMGVSFMDMVTEVFRRPVFFVWLGAMLLTAATELGPQPWVELALSNVVGMRGILILVYIAGLMFVMRHFAGSIAHKISDTGLLWASCLLAAIGLYLLSIASSPVSALIAATFWGTGACFLWPTMLSAIASRFPRGGAWSIGLIGSAGAASIFFLLPKLGGIYDQAKIDAAGGAEALSALGEGPELTAVLSEAATTSFQSVAVMPLVLLVVFGAIWFFERQAKTG